MLELVSSIFAANVLTVIFVWGFRQFVIHDENAPWLGYAAFLMPLALFIIALLTIEGLPPHFGA